jgi:hypothetical protein
VNGEERRAAVVVIHGIGEQNPFETLDAFARGLGAELDVRAEQLEHRLIWRGGRADSAVRVPLKGPLGRAAVTALDLYEYYWAGEAERRITLRAVLAWIARTSVSPLWHWSQQPALLFREAGALRRKLWIFVREVLRAVMLVVIAALILSAFVYAAASAGRVADAGRSLWAGFRNMQHPVWGLVFFLLAAFALLILNGGRKLLGQIGRSQAWVDPGTSRWWAAASFTGATVLALLAALLYWWFGLDLPGVLDAGWNAIRPGPVLLPLIAAGFTLVARRILIKFLGDVALYVTADEKSSFFRTRELILSGATRQLRTLLQDRSYSAVYLAGHSLGSVIAYDTVNRLAREVRSDSEGAAGKLEQEELDRLYGLLTFGSPLDKVYYFFRTLVGERQVVRAQLLSSLHGFHQQASGRDYGHFRFRPYRIPEPGDFRWLNVYAPADPVSGFLDFYRVSTQVRRPYWNPLGAHLQYWNDPLFYREVAAWL